MTRDSRLARPLFIVKFRYSHGFVSLWLACVVACSNGPQNGPGQGTASSGAPGAGGALGSGTGGGPANVSGGALGTGGRVDSGGSAGSAGSAGTSNGGSAPQGGATATGGAAGSAGAAGGAAKASSTLIGGVTFATPSQSFKGEISVGMTTAIAGAEIRYTTDHSLPTSSSTLYAGTPISLTATTELRAQAFVAGAASGLVSTALYIARTFDATSDLPLVLVDGFGKGKPTNKDVSVLAAVMVFEPVAGEASFSALPTLAVRAGYHVRGQSSANFPQAPYKVELWDNQDKDADYPVLGMPSDSDWALIPPYYDRALIRNPFVYTLGRELGLQAPRTAYAEVYLNYAARAVEAGDYQGIYWLTETIKNNKVRTNLKQLEEVDTALPAISGGYIFKFDQAASEPPTLACTGSNPVSGGLGRGGGAGGTCWVDLEVVDPDPLLMQQQTWLTQYIQTFHDVLHTTPIGDYAAHIDVPSFVDYLIVNELTRNVDAYVRSAYYHKDRDGKLKAGPLWDYNFSLAVGGSNTTAPTGAWQFQGTRNVNNWYPKLTADPAFMDKVKARWRELRQGPMSQASLDQRITMLIAPLKNAVVRDFAKWPVDKIIMANGFVRGPTVATWDGQVQAMRDFVSQRSAWMDSQWQ